MVMRVFTLSLVAALAWVYVGFLRRSFADAGPEKSGPGSALFTTLAAWTTLCLLGGFGGILATGSGVITIVLGLGLVALAFTLLAPWPLATLVAIPNGWHRTAYALARLSTLRSHPDPVGVAMATAARALLRSPDGTREAAAWIEAHGKGRPLTPGALLAHGLLASWRGDDALARRLLTIVERFDPRSHDDIVLRWAREWRAAEAAERGAWSEVVEATARLGPNTPATRWLEGVGRRYAGSRDAPDDEALDARWRQVPQHRAVSDLHHACLGHHRNRPNEPKAPQPSHPLQRHVDALAHPSVTTLTAAVAAWTAVADDPTFAHRLGRAVADLSAVASEAGLPMPPLPPSLQGHIHTDTDDAVLRPLELAGQQLAERLMAPTPIDPLSALYDWMELDALLDDVRRRGSPGALRLAFRPAYGPLTTLSVTLYNDLGEPLLSNALTRWLLDLAREVGDARCVEHQTRNLAASSTAR